MSSLYQEWLPRGSNLYYSLLSVQEPKREAMVALHAYRQTLNYIAERYHEASIAKIKLQWWQAEIERTYQGQAQHIITQSLQKTATTFLPKTALLAMIEAALVSLETQRFETQKELAQHYQHTGGIVQGLMAQVLQGSTDSTLEKQTHLEGIALEVIRHLIDMPYHFARQDIYLPMESIAETELATMLSHPQQNNTLRALLKTQSDYAKKIYQEAQALSPKPTPLLRPLRIGAALAFKQLTLIEQDGFRIFEHRLELSPIRKLFTAWRTF